MTYFQWLPLESRSKEEDHVILAMLLEQLSFQSRAWALFGWGTGGHVPPCFWGGGTKGPFPPPPPMFYRARFFYLLPR